MPKLWADNLDDHRALVRRRLIDAVAELLGERPIDEITMAAVAERAGMARSAVYNHVDHLHDLVLWHSEETLEQWTADLRRDGEDQPAPRRLEALVRHSFETFASDPTAAMDLASHLDEERLARLREILSPVMTHLSDIIADGVAGGELIDEDPAELTTHAWAVISGYRTMLGDGRIDAEAAADTCVRLLHRALTPDGAS